MLHWRTGSVIYMIFMLRYRHGRRISFNDNISKLVASFLSTEMLKALEGILFCLGLGFIYLCIL